MRRMDTWSWLDAVVPFLAMLMITCLDMAVLTIVKATMNDRMDNIVYLIYRNALGTFILLPFFIVHIFRKAGRPPLTFRILSRFFILGLFGVCLFEVLVYIGVSYSSPIMASAISNLTPGVTFLIASFFRIEKIDIRSSSSVAKLLGTMLVMSGAMVFIFYQGPTIFQPNGSPGSPNQLFLSKPSEWIFGGLLIIIGGTFGCIWVVLQTTTAREYPDQQTIVFFSCLFGTVQCIALTSFVGRDLSAWIPQRGIMVTSVVLGALYSIAFRINAMTWCLEKKGPVFVAMFSPLSIVIAAIMGVTFLHDSLHLGSVIGATIIAGGFYTVIWGQAREKNKILVFIGDDSDVLDESRSSVDQTAPLISSRSETEC